MSKKKDWKGKRCAGLDGALTQKSEKIEWLQWKEWKKRKKRLFEKKCIFMMFLF